MELIVEGNLIYAIKHIGSATIKEFYGYVHAPDPTPEPPDRISILERQISELSVMIGDLILGGME